ncbi:MAG: DNA polymerase III subunit delta' [bacterium]
MPFQEVFGQDRVLRILRKALEKDSLPHAYLFYGPDGVGRFKVALSLAKALLCGNLARDFCGTCPSCRRVQSEEHPDVLILRPQSRKGEKDWVVDPEMGEIRIDQVRELRHWTSVGSFQGAWRVAILEGADKMNAAAANALLKTLEEPPPKALLILVSPTRTQLLPTIVSRCQAVHFPPITRKELEAALADRLKGPPGDVTVLAGLADGSIGRALALDREWVFEGRRHWIERLCRLLQPGSGASFRDLAEDLAGFPRLLGVLELYQTWFRDLLVLGATGEADRLLNRDLLSMMEQASAAGDPSAWARDFFALQRAKDALQNRSNTQLVAEGLLLELLDHRSGR